VMFLDIFNITRVGRAPDALAEVHMGAGSVVTSTNVTFQPKDAFSESQQHALHNAVTGP
ncbi:hypothetical protein ACJX0J_017637, partial [Zea mays]